MDVCSRPGCSPDTQTHGTVPAQVCISATLSAECGLWSGLDSGPDTRAGNLTTAVTFPAECSRPVPLPDPDHILPHGGGADILQLLRRRHRHRAQRKHRRWYQELRETTVKVSLVFCGRRRRQRQETDQILISLFRFSSSECFKLMFYWF